MAPFRFLLEVLESRLTPVTLTVDAAANVHLIDPNVYGTAFATTAQLADLNAPLSRNGGNASDTYSYQQDSTNHGSDWFFESIKSGNGNGQGMDAWINETRAGGAAPSVTVNLFDWAAKNAVSSTLGSFPVNVYGAQQSVDPWNTNLGNGVRANGTNVTGNDPNIAYVANSPTFEQVWVQHLVSTFGNSQSGGVPYYTMGNEPGLWNSTHRDIHPAGNTLTELRDRIIAYASMIKAVDPGAKILGPEEWGWTNYFISGADAAASNWGATYNGLNAQAWLLDQLRQQAQSTGTRLIDYFTLHDYPQGGEFSNTVSTAMQTLRNQSTRQLWDPSYVDQSWIASTGIDGGRVNLINRMKAWVSTYYPGTKIGVTEYNWGRRRAHERRHHPGGHFRHLRPRGARPRQPLDHAGHRVAHVPGDEALPQLRREPLDLRQHQREGHGPQPGPGVGLRGDPLVRRRAHDHGGEQEPRQRRGQHADHGEPRQLRRWRAGPAVAAGGGQPLGPHDREHHPPGRRRGLGQQLHLHVAEPEHRAVRDPSRRGPAGPDRGVGDLGRRPGGGELDRGRGGGHLQRVPKHYGRRRDALSVGNHRHDVHRHRRDQRHDVLLPGQRRERGRRKSAVGGSVGDAAPRDPDRPRGGSG